MCMTRVYLYTCTRLDVLEWGLFTLYDGFCIEEDVYQFLDLSQFLAEGAPPR